MFFSLSLGLWDLASVLSYLFYTFLVGLFPLVPFLSGAAGSPRLCGLNCSEPKVGSLRLSKFAITR